MSGLYDVIFVFTQDCMLPATFAFNVVHPGRPADISAHLSFVNSIPCFKHKFIRFWELFFFISSLYLCF